MPDALMTLKHQSPAAPAPAGRPWTVVADGCLRVDAGPLWLTRFGDPDDHILGPGEQIALRRGDRIVAGAWLPDRPIAWRYDGARSGREGFFATFFAAFLAGFLAAVADAFEAVAARARSAAASASRAQGCMSIGDSMASSGALK